MNKPSKSQVLYERNMELQKAYAEVSSLTEQRDHWQQQTLSKSELVAALEARCRDAAKLISDVVETPDQFETEWNKAAREWLASTSETCALRLRTATFHKVAANQKLTVGEQSEWDGYMERLRNFVAGSKKGIDND